MVIKKKFGLFHLTMKTQTVRTVIALPADDIVRDYIIVIYTQYRPGIV